MLDSATQGLSDIGSELETALSQTAVLEASISETQDVIEGIHAAVVADMVNDIYWTPEAYQVFVDVGVPVELGDRVVRLLGLSSSSWEEYVSSNALFEWRRRVERVDDPDLQRAWDAWSEAKIDSDEEFGALVEVQLRLYLAALEGLAEAGAIAGSL